LLSTDTHVDIAYSLMFGTCFRHVDRSVSDASIVGAIAPKSTFALDNVMCLDRVFTEYGEHRFGFQWRRVNRAYNFHKYNKVVQNI